MTARIHFSAKHSHFVFPRSPLIMGVLNVTPDSFSDGGNYLEPDRALEHAREMAQAGADIIDIGGESTRPFARTVAKEEELRRVLPVLERLQDAIAVPLSIDTQKPEVARRAVAAGASIINDIRANREQPEMWDLVAETRAGYICMHMKGTPQTMQQAPVYRDVVQEVDRFFQERMGLLESRGVRLEQIVFDVGIGFGKTPRHNLELLSRLETFKKHSRPLLLGVSRKSFMGHLLGIGQAQARVPAGLACAAWAVQRGVQIIRTHDVMETAQFLRMWRMIGEFR